MDVHQLEEALADTIADFPVKLFICRYGMKVEAKRFFENILEPAYNIMQDQLGIVYATSCWNQKIMDWGLQSTMTGNPVLVKPSADLSNLEWVDFHNSYSMLGALGAGYGGLTINGIDGGEIAFVKVYAGGWVHHLKAIMHTYIHTYLHTYIHTHMHIHTYIHTYILTYLLT